VVGYRVIRITVALAAVLLVVATATLSWLVYRPPSLVLAPNATDVQVFSDSFADQRITYEAPGSPYGWYYVVKRKLLAQGWDPPIAQTGLLRHPEVYWRISSFGLAYLAERVALEGEPNLARIAIHREIIIPWSRYLP